MSLRKLAGLAAGLALSAGLIGSGVSAAFTSSVSAAQAINVGTFGCQITASSAGTIASGNTSVTYDAPTIISSAASSSPFTFTVTNTGSIPAKLHLTQTVPAAPFTSLLVGPVNDVVLAQNGNHTYAGGLSWPELTNSNLSQAVSISYGVTCGEVGATTVSFSSTGPGPGVGDITDTFVGANFQPGTPVVITYAFGGGSPIALGDYFLNPTSDASGNFGFSFG